jgi:alanine dehydrogenase
MNICIPKERRDSEYRVGLTPAGVQLLCHAGHKCFIEHDAGVGSGFSDFSYQSAGGVILYSGEEVYGRADLLIKVARPTFQECEWLREDTIILGFLHLAAGRADKLDHLVNNKITSIGFEIIQDAMGNLPVLIPLSQLGGRMVPQIASTLAQNNYGGKGILLGGIPGVPPAEVVIIGGGTAGRAAARNFIGMGASVYVFDQDLAKLRIIDHHFQGKLVTMVSHQFNLEKVCTFADVIVGAILIPGERTPVIVSREMIKSMRPRSIVIDLSIDQGGCIETSHPTTHSNPTFSEEGILHYCVPNMTGVLGRTATHAMNNASWPFIKLIAEAGLDSALDQNPTLKRGLYTYKGDIVHPYLSDSTKGRI